ncbi:hypothetical protein D9756_002574 [Leucocoprinus leucothites]|uniref:Uncharacterized protein n=1 Tax=Leucocoprinus leucothites TaxID=201217 RepID=A0A8H5LLK7_9AGAR|nr:hypothetical protein D9756_002574 [Leucoagaricus leucothites]
MPVASGDTFDTSVILWTRAEPVPSNSGQDSDRDIPEAFSNHDVDYTVKVEATGLEADTNYFYQFAACANPIIVSPIGTITTLANRNTPAEKVNGGKPLVLAVFSCSQFQAGWFNAYAFAARNTTADVLVHLGDYIYEPVGNGIRISRQTLGRELATIDDYRHV